MSDEPGDEGGGGAGGPGPGPVRRPGMRALVLSALRSGATVTVLGVAYFIMPLEGLRTLSDLGILLVSMIVIVAMVAYQVSAILRAHYPALRAVEAVAFTAALLLFAFSITYDVMATEQPSAFTTPLTRLDSLYFTVTVFGTVGFGDITAVTQTARAVVTVQMLFDFLFVGVAVRAIAGAVELSRKRGAAKK